MPDKKGRLTGMEAAFAKYYGQTGDASYSAAKAGYSAPVVVGSQKKSDPRIAAAAREAARQLLRTEGAEVGVRVLIEIAGDAKQPAGARVQAADKLVRHAGLSAETNDGKEPHEMTGDEIARAIAELERIASDRAKPVIEVEANPPGGGLFD